MRSEEELERLWSEGSIPEAGKGTVAHLVVRVAAGDHREVEEMEIDPDRGVEGDYWERDPERDPDRQVTVMMSRVAELLSEGRPVHLSGDNLLVDLDLSEDALPVGTRLRVGQALLEVTAAPHLGCETFSERFGQGALRWVNRKVRRARRLRGVNCRVIEGGRITRGAPVVVNG